ncbi:hypothetical protein [Methylobacterium sp. J-068]|uniref:hypothetical protein n=1 Tax=Methylobacterium sp. J-068 TaxID=2836649 RepID=UPI001FB9F524|nr:hypothetical protein [Methylobacterium sp. J-068]MCJ2032620.1 hypothetical protein [Methylobacterium sp. J-068]
MDTRVRDMHILALFCVETVAPMAGHHAHMKTPPPSTAAEDAAPERRGRLQVRVPSNLALAVRLAAEVHQVPLSNFVAGALHDRLARDAGPTRKS